MQQSRELYTWKPVATFRLAVAWLTPTGSLTIIEAMSATPTPPAGTDPRKDSLIQYPCVFPIKVMGAMADGFAQAMAEVAREFDPGFDPSSVELRPSKGGNYLGVTLMITATSRQQLDDLYRALTGHPMVKIVL